MENNTDKVTLVNLVRDYFHKRGLAYSITEEPDNNMAGIIHPDDMVWLGWIYDDRVKSFDGGEIKCILASDHAFFEKLEAWLKENLERWKLDKANR